MLRASLLEPQYLPEEKTNNCGRERDEKKECSMKKTKPSDEVSQVKVERKKYEHSKTQTLALALKKTS
jgi:hypothetical protein